MVEHYFDAARLSVVREVGDPWLAMETFLNIVQRSPWGVVDQDTIENLVRGGYLAYPPKEAVKALEIVKDEKDRAHLEYLRYYPNLNYAFITFVEAKWHAEREE